MFRNSQKEDNAIENEVVDVLRPLNDEEFLQLLELYRDKHESNKFQYLYLYTQHEWNKQLKKLNVDKEIHEWRSFRKTFYTHRNGDFRKYGTYVCIHQDLIQSVAFHTWETNCSELLDCLSNTKLIEWKNCPLLICVANELSEEVKRIALFKRATIKPRQCQGLILNIDKILKLKVPSLPDGYKETVLEGQDAKLVYSLWANKKEASLDYIKGFIKLKRCIGIKEESTNNIVGWIFQNEFSGLGILQVLESAQRKGLGKYLAISMSKLIAKTCGVNSSAFVVVGNIKSESLLQKIGYEGIVIHEWIQLGKIE